VDDGELRVSNIQTGTFSGPPGSPIGQHRHRHDLAVSTAQPTRRLYTLSGGLVEAVLRASPDPTCMLAFWLVGFEEQSPEQSGEICVAELFGSAIALRRSGVRIGVKPHNDPCLHDDMEEVTLDIDAGTWHTYAAEWTAERVRFFVDDRLVRSVQQRIDYPLQLMVDLFEFPPHTDRDPPRTRRSARSRPSAGTGRADAPGYDRLFSASGLCTAVPPDFSDLTRYWGSSSEARTLRPPASVSEVILRSTVPTAFPP
jgi:hypothetical protein